MPNCTYCKKETPTTKMILVREYEGDTGTFWYFCSWLHLIRWLEERFMRPKENKKPPNLKKRSED